MTPLPPRFIRYLGGMDKGILFQYTEKVSTLDYYRLFYGIGSIFCVSRDTPCPEFSADYVSAHYS